MKEKSEPFKTKKYVKMFLKYNTKYNRNMHLLGKNHRQFERMIMFNSHFAIIFFIYHEMNQFIFTLFLQFLVIYYVFN